MPSTPPSPEELAQAQESLGVSFSDTGLLRLALTHQSYLNENPSEGGESNERLEFLGDSALNYIVGRYLYDSLPGLPEGDLTVRRAEAVRREALEKAGRRLGLGQILVMGRGEEASGGSERSSNLANCFEALVGATVLDRGIEEAWPLVTEWLGPELRDVVQSDTPKDPKSLLQELVQGKGLQPPAYELVGRSGPDNEPLFSVRVIVDGEELGTGTAGRKIDAEREAAREAAARLG